MGNLVYNSLNAYYSAKTDNYYKIHIPNTEGIYSMLNIEMSMRQDYSIMKYGKIFLNLIHNKTDIFYKNMSSCTVIGSIGRNLRIFVDGQSDIYVNNVMFYSVLSVDKILTGDTIRSIDISGVEISQTETIPSTAFEIPIKFAVTEGANSNIINDLRAGLTWGIKCIFIEDENGESHESIMKSNWSSIFANDYSGLVFLTTGFRNRVFWLCWGYSNARYGFAMRMGYDNTPAFHQLVGGIWKDPVNL